MAMFAYPGQEIRLKEFPEFLEVVYMSSVSSSMYLSVGLGFLKTFIRFKADSELISEIQHRFEATILLIKPLAAELGKQKELETFQNTFFTCTQGSHRLETMTWLEYYIQNSPEIVESIEQGVKFIICYLLSQKKRPFGHILNTPVSSSEVFEALQLLCEYFGIYVRLVWDSGHFVYKPERCAKSFAINIYYTPGTGYALLTTKSELEIDKNNSNYLTLHSQLFDYTQLEPYPNQNNRVQDKNPSDLEFLDPLLKNLISLMAQKIVENQFYSLEIQQALISTQRKFPGVLHIPGLMQLSKIQQILCKKHPNIVYIQLYCGNKHCQYCIFDIIILEYPKKNNKISCPCGVRIPLKEIDEIKAKEVFKSYFNNNKY
jgi:hypothetical protein